ncbi:MAG: helicase C-terminal domain-containing protein [Candidatus Promineifilaceae bacterium]
MSTTYAAIDLETTGLDPLRDAIIEVAVITFDLDGVMDEFSSLVYPQQTIPAAITELTGITEAMVANAPTITMLRPQLRRLLADHVVVGHNVDFDMGFLQSAYVGAQNLRLDTVTLASIVLPNAGKYALDALVEYLKLPAPAGRQEHRAMADARQTVELFYALLSRAQQMGVSRLNEIVQAGRRMAWPETRFFEEAAALAVRHGFGGGGVQRVEKLFDPPKVEGHTLTGVGDNPKPIDAAAIAGMLKPGANFSRAFPDYEYRQQQVTMVQRVAEAFNKREHLFIEAGTGTGKSIGYLLPAAFWADANDCPVVISTNTINLQDQLIHKDIPQLQKMLFFQLRAAVLKGKRNYLCTRLFEQMRHRGPNNADEMTLYARILNWLPQSDTGDVNEITLRTREEQIVWSRLSAENDVCNRDTCAQARCPLHVSRQRAAKAHLIIVNHSLLLADVAAGNMVIPEYRHLIIDEAHHMEAAVTDSLSFEADKRYLDTLLEDVVRPRAGSLAQAQSAVQAAVPADVARTFQAYADKIREQGALAVNYVEDFFATLQYFLRDHLNQRSQYAQQLRLTPALRKQPYFDEVEISWSNLSKPLKTISEGLLSLAAGLGDMSESFEIENGADLGLELTNLGRDLAEILLKTQAIISAPQAEWIYWIEQWRDRISLHAAPLHIGPLFAKHIFEAKDTVILTSATMRTSKPGAATEPGFAYIRERLNGQAAAEMAVGSPFDYKNSTLVYLPIDMPEPNQPGYQRYVEQAIVDVARTLGGRTMALFTSYSQLAQTAPVVEAALKSDGISVLAQLEGTSRQQLLEQFKAEGAKAVLLGTRSFWEGVDVPGPALQAVLLVKIPFDVPSDPIFAARSETYDSPFFEYSIPEAVLRFRQGFGRLIRRQNDEGIVVILDKRVISKRYGQLFLEALPECTIIRQRIGRLSELTERWFNRERA